MLDVDFWFLGCRALGLQSSTGYKICAWLLDRFSVFVASENGRNMYPKKPCNSIELF